MHSRIVPLVKNRGGALDDKSNYRAIALSTSVSKVLELVLLERLAPYPHTSDAQFGFKEGHSTTHATLVLKEVINYYNIRGSPVYACFLDARKAFGRVSYSKLLSALAERGVPSQFLKLLLYWFKMQTLDVKWDGHLSEKFNAAEYRNTKFRG